MKRILLTGGCGFIGAHLARRLLAEGHELHLIVRLDHPTWRVDGIRDRVVLHDCDLTDLAAVRRAVAQARPEWIFHLAAHGAYSWQTDWQQITGANVTGTMNLVHAAAEAGFEALVNAGTSSEYGYKDHAPAETEWVEPNSHYAVTKAAATLFCRFMAQQQKLPITTLRLYSAYGAWEDPNRLMPTLLTHGRKGALPPLVAPETARDYVYVDDVTEAFLLAAGAIGRHPPGAVYNVGTGVQTTLREVVDVARRILAIPAEPQWGSMPRRPWDASCWVADNRRIREELGWAPRFTLEQGLRAMTGEMEREGLFPGTGGGGAARG